MGATIRAIHVQAAGGNGVQIHTAIATTGRFAANPTIPLRTFGRNDYPNSSVTIIGVRNNGAWRIYAQYSSDGCKTISATDRLHPGVKTRL